MGEFTQLYKKNFKIWARNRCGCLCDLITTVVFALLLLMIAGLAENEKKEATSYLDKVAFIGPQDSPTAPPFPQNHIAHIMNLADNPLLGKALLKKCVKQQPDNRSQKKNAGFVALSPESNPIIQKLKTLFVDGLSYKVVMFQDSDEILDYVRDTSYGGLSDDGVVDQVCFGVTFNETVSDKWAYNFMFNSSGNPSRHDIKTFDDSQIEDFEYEAVGDWKKQVSSGLLYLTNFIDNEILKIASGDNNALINAKITHMPIPEYSKSTLYSYSNSGDISTFLIFSILMVYLGFVYNVLNEKEHRIAQNLRNMGMSMTSYYLSWILFYVTLLFCLSIIWLAIIKIPFFPDANFILVWFLFFMCGLSFLGFGMFIIAFFEKAKAGTLCAIVMFFVLYAGSITMTSMDTRSVSQNTRFALSPIAGLTKAGAIVTLVQTYNQPFTFALWNTEILYFKCSSFFWICLFEFLILTALGIYLDQILPKQTSVRKHPLFCCIRRKHSKDLKKSSENLKSMVSIGNFEDVDEALKAQSKSNKTLEITNLRKEYPNGKVAVNDLNLTMYSDQIFALLGHNGAGKTTTISMVSGLLPTSGGEIKVLGYDALEDPEKVKEVMGVCPQTNPIYPTLTCKDHLILYANVKKTKLTPNELDKEIDTILSDIDLLDKKDFPAGKLSGGQKRKLCVACAFIGGSKVILLDEPTSGLDVAARRHLWEMLKKYKKDKIIILTTHFMDEADFLGDRIGIMGEGKLLTCGSSLFLKNKYGVGYSLTIVKADSSVSTQKITDLIKNNVPSAELEDDISKEVKYILPADELDRFESLFQAMEEQAGPMGIENFGVSLTTLEDVFLKIAQISVEKDHFEENNTKNKGGNVPLDKEEDEEIVELKKIRVPDSQIFGMHFGALTKKRFIYFKRDLKGLACEIILPILFVFIGISLTLIQNITEPVGGYIDASIYEFKPEFWTNTGNDLLSSINADNVALVPKPSVSVQAFDSLLVDEFTPKRLFGSYVTTVDETNNNYEYVIFANTTASNSGVIGLNLMNTAILKLVTGNPEAEIKPNFLPLPLTEQFKNFESSVDGFLTVFLISLAFSFIPSSMIMFIVRERENNAKHQQIVSGVSLAAYWFSTFLVDYLKYLIVAIFTVIAVLVYDAQSFIEDGAIGMTILLLLVYGLNLVSFTYLTSFLFKSPSTAQIFSFMFSLLTGFIFMLTSVILRIIPSTQDISLKGTEWIFSIFPMFQISFGLYVLVTRQLWQVILELDELPGVWSRYSATPQFVYALVFTVINFALIFMIELKKNNVKKDNEGYQFVDKDTVEQDEDVLKEAEEVKNNDDYAIKVQGMSKVYSMVNSSGGCCSKKLISRKAAVKDISFGVRKGECFGLLGTNGAGKTSTFKVLSGEIQPTMGFAQIAGLNVATDMKKIRNLIGYCPQFDALLEKMTTREHLEMYAAIKGIPVDKREKMIKRMISKLNLTKFENVQAGTYSGGNKRKLSVAIALLGNPPIVFLDEPSSGMDPEARRFMWSVVGNISTKKKASSVVLTTHSMEEAEALSTKLAIMVEGRVKCIGPVQALKNKFGKGFEIETKLKLPEAADINNMLQLANISNKDEKLDKQGIQLAMRNLGQEEHFSEIKEFGSGAFIQNELKNKGHATAGLIMEFIHIKKNTKVLKDFLENTFGDISIIEAYQSFIRWKVENNVKLSQLFGEMQKSKDKLNLSQYSIKQTSIEQIFIKFANERQPDMDN